MKFFHFTVSLGLLLLCESAIAVPSHLRKTRLFNDIQNGLQATGSDDNSTTNDVTCYVTLPLDHKNPKLGTFSNRYFVNDKFYKPGGPIMVFDNGELTALNTDDPFNTQILSYAEEHNALMISWEHRYYGESLPPHPHFNPWDDGVDPEVLGAWYQHLTMENALDDLAMFAKQFRWKGKDYSPGKAHWFMVGASYPGIRVAYMQVRHPGIFDFGLASSAPVGLKVDYWEYLVGVERGMARYNLSSCAADIYNISDWASKAYEAKNISVLQAFESARRGGNSTGIGSTIEELVDSISDWFMKPLTTFQYFSVFSNGDWPSPGIIGTMDFCRYFQSENNTSSTVITPSMNKGGLSSRFDSETVAMLYAKAIFKIYGYWPHPNDQETVIENNGWRYQTCYEMGVFIVSNMKRPKNLLPSFMSVETNIRRCKKQFGSYVPDLNGLLKNNAKLRKEFGGRGLELKNVVWTNGELDPWRFGSGDSDIPEDGGRLWTATTDIPKCGERLPRGKQISYTINDAVHAQDFDDWSKANATDPAPVINPRTGLTGHPEPPVLDARNAQELWRKAMKAWLKCPPKY